MNGLGVALDLGTSGLRAQARELPSGEVLSTALTARHPFPGGNVVDHLHFALEVGPAVARAALAAAVGRVLAALRVPLDRVARLAVCGNPVQLSLFQGIELRDLAFAGPRKLRALGVEPPERDGAVLRARELPGLGLPPACEVIVPPAVRHEVGADALAVILRSGMLERDETAIAVDLGTNAELALRHRGTVLTASAAAGPALEGQHLACGTLAVPGAISDLARRGEHHRLMVLDGDLLPRPGALVDLARGREVEASAGPAPGGVTGTGVIAALAEALAAGLVTPPHIETPDALLRLAGGVHLDEHDLAEAGKAVGAIRAATLTLCHEAGVSPGDVETAYLAGAAGTYVDARKAHALGLLPPGVRTIHQLGNTSLEQAGVLVTDPAALERMRGLARALRATHCLLAASPVFQRLFVLELATWTEGMPMDRYRALLRRYGYPDLPPAQGVPEVRRRAEREVAELGTLGLALVEDPGRVTTLALPGCTACARCVERCPGHALSLDSRAAPPAVTLRESSCRGMACRRCEPACPEGAFSLPRFFAAGLEAAP